MGLSVKKDQFSSADYQEFSHRVKENLVALKHLLARPDFGEGPSSFGAELEMYIVDSNHHAAPINEYFLTRLNDKQLQPELNRFNLEYNLSVVEAKGSPFSAIENEIQLVLDKLNTLAKEKSSRVIPIGILPTLRKSDIDSKMITDSPRYHALSKGLKKMRGGPFKIEINGKDSLSICTDDVALEGANTSFQFHWRVPPKDFANIFNAVQLLTPLAVGLGSNSPTLLEHELWDETRIALFKQSIDDRSPANGGWRPPSRIPFGYGWIREGAYECFAETIALFPPLLPIIGTEDSTKVADCGGIPKLEELRLHHGTVWPWNRAIYDDAAGGHLRIEMRFLPAGPSIKDMTANAAFVVGAAQALKHRIPDLLPLIPFHYANYNFYRAAQYGLDSQIIWPCKNQTTLRQIPISTAIEEMLPLAQEGLSSLDINNHEVNRLLGVFKNRLRSGVTGARWQRNMLARVRQSESGSSVYAAMLENYIREYSRGIEVSEWSDCI